MQAVPEPGTFDYKAPLDFHIVVNGVWKPHTAVFERLASELFKHCELKPCMHSIYCGCLCAVAPPPKQWKKGPPKDNSSAERDFLAKARALQEAEDSACALPSHTYTPIYSYRWDHTLGFEGEGPPLNLVSLNCNGVLSNDTWQTLLKLAQFLKVDILCLQEPNIPVGDTRITRFEPTQSSTPSNPTWV